MNIEPPKAKSAVANESKAKVTETAPRLRASAKPQMTPLLAGYDAIHIGIVDVLQAARVQAARNINALMAASYWEIGRRIVEAEQKGKRKAGYGEMLIKRLGVDLTAQFGRGFGWRNLFQMRAFHLAWPEILQTVSAILEAPQSLQTASAISTRPHPASARLFEIVWSFPLPWSAYVRLLSVKSDPARHFYETEALRGGWSVRQLDRQVNS